MPDYRDEPMAMFATTRWSLVMMAGDRHDKNVRALSELCEIYRPAVLNWFRYQGLDPDEAGDLTQSFFAKVLEGHFLGSADPERGRFRTFLSTALRNFYYHQLEKNNAQKRGSGAVHLPYEDTVPGDETPTPERVFDQNFARVVIARALSRLSDEARSADKQALFKALRPYLLESPDSSDYEKLVEELGMRRNTIAVAVHRMRARLKELTRKELSDTVSDEGALDEEIRVLRGSLAGGA